MSILDRLPHLATAKRRRREKDTLGGSRDVSILVFSKRPCWRQQAGDREITEYKKRGIGITNKVFFTEDPKLDETHFLEIGGEQYEVKSSPEPDASAGLGVIYKVMVERTTADEVEV